MSHQTEVEAIARRAFADHEIIRLAPLPGGGRDITIGKPGTGIHRFRLVDYGGHLVWTGDIGTAVLRAGYSLEWLLRNDRNHQYVAQKIEALDEPKRVYTREAALAWLDDERAVREEDDDVPADWLEAWQEVRDAVSEGDLTHDELLRMYLDNRLLHDGGDVPDWTEYSPSVCWLLECATLAKRLLGLEVPA